MWPPEGVCQKSCDHCAGQKMVCTVGGVQVPNGNSRIGQEERGHSPRKRAGRVGSDVELEGSGTRGWRQEVSSALVGIRELLREQNGYLKRIAQSLIGLGSQ